MLAKAGVLKRCLHSGDSFQGNQRHDFSQVYNKLLGQEQQDARQQVVSTTGTGRCDYKSQDCGRRSKAPKIKQVIKDVKDVDVS